MFNHIIVIIIIIIIIIMNVFVNARLLFYLKCKKKHSLMHGRGTLKADIVTSSRNPGTRCH
jgi:hypothetical protein